MKSDMKLSGKMVLFIIISCIIVVAGVVVGTVCHFMGYGYFNSGADWTSDQSVTLTWYYTEGFTDEDPTLKDYCETAFEENGISYYAVSYGTADDGTGGDIVYRFTSGTDSNAISKACDEVRAEISTYISTTFSDSFIYRTSIYPHETEALTSGYRALMYAGIAVASIIVFEFLYVLIRYKMSMALGGALACFHNLALYLCIVSLARIPVGTSMYAFAVITVLLTMIGCLFTFGKLRKNMKNEDLAALSPYEIVDKSATETFVTNLGITLSLTVLAVIMFVLLMISSLSPLAVLTPALCALVAFASCLYGTCFFMPAVYSRFKKIGLKFQRKKKPAKNSEPKKEKA